MKDSMLGDVGKEAVKDVVMVDVVNVDLLPKAMGVLKEVKQEKNEESNKATDVVQVASAEEGQRSSTPKQTPSKKVPEKAGEQTAKAAGKSSKVTEKEKKEKKEKKEQKDKKEKKEPVKKIKDDLSTGVKYQ